MNAKQKCLVICVSRTHKKYVTSTDLWRRHNGKCVHDAVGILFPDLADEQCSHARPGSPTQRVRHLESLQTVAALRLLAHNVEHRVNQLGALRVVTLGPVVAGAALTEHEVVRPKDLTERTRPDGVHGARLEVNQDRTWNVLAT